MSKLTSDMLRVLRIAERDGAVIAGKGAHAGHVERVSAATVLALLRRGLLSHTHGSERGEVGGRLTPAGRAALDPTQIVPHEEIAVPETRQVEPEFIEIWMNRLAKEAQGLDFNDPDDRATFRMLMRAAMRNMKWSSMKDLARYMGGGKSGSREATVKMIAALYMQRARDPQEAPGEKKTPAQLDADIAEILARSKP